MLFWYRSDFTWAQEPSARLMCRCPTAPHHTGSPKWGTALIFNGRIRSPETSVRNYHYSLRNGPKERSSHLLCGGSLRSRTGLWFCLAFCGCWVRLVRNLGLCVRAGPHLGTSDLSSVDVVAVLFARVGSQLGQAILHATSSASSRLPHLSALVLRVPGVV